MVKIGGQRLTLDEFDQIVCKGDRVKIDPQARERVADNHTFLKDFAKGKIIYGINTGFGPMAQYRIDEADQHTLQLNLIRSHAAGSGGTLGNTFVRGMMLARLNSLLVGNSGVHPSLIDTLEGCLNQEVYPVIYEHGGVGASGDLVQLAHLALALIGEGEVEYQGQRRSSAEVFKEVGIEPVKIHLREGLALLNGTSTMTSIGLSNLRRAYRLLGWSLAASALVNELVGSYDDYFSEPLNAVKAHRGQQKIAAQLRRLLKGSGMMRQRHQHLFGQNNHEQVLEKKVQEYYSLRCIPQILGPILDTLNHAEAVLTDELNSANDNPIVDQEAENVFHGGNFHGDYVSLEMDKLKLVLTRMAMLAERQINFLMNPRLNQILPPFVNLGKLGLNFGLQGLQFSATSTTAECQTLSSSMYVHSIPTNNDNQDIVSMGTNAALLCHRVVENVFEVLSIEMLALLQAVDHLQIEQKLAPPTQTIYSQLRALVPAFENDAPLAERVGLLKEHLSTSEPDLALALESQVGQPSVSRT